MTSWLKLFSIIIDDKSSVFGVVNVTKPSVTSEVMHIAQSDRTQQYDQSNRGADTRYVIQVALGERDTMQSDLNNGATSRSDCIANWLAIAYFTTLQLALLRARTRRPA